MAAILVTGLLLAAPAVGARLPRLTHARVAFWARVQHCEEGVTGWRTRGPRYSGGVGFANTTWMSWARELGLERRYPNAADAPAVVQMQVADYGYRIHHGYWGSIADRCAGSYPA